MKSFIAKWTTTAIITVTILWDGQHNITTTIAHAITAIAHAITTIAYTITTTIAHAITTITTTIAHATTTSGFGRLCTAPGPLR